MLVVVLENDGSFIQIIPIAASVDMNFVVIINSLSPGLERPHRFWTEVQVDQEEFDQRLAVPLSEIVSWVGLMVSTECF